MTAAVETRVVALPFFRVTQRRERGSPQEIERDAVRTVGIEDLRDGATHELIAIARLEQLRGGLVRANDRAVFRKRQRAVVEQVDEIRPVVKAKHRVVLVMAQEETLL